MKQIEDDKTIDLFDEWQEEAHYVHTLNDIVLFMKDYGYVKVLEDIKEHYKKSFKVEVME